MANFLKELEIWFLAQVKSLSPVTALVGEKTANMSAGKKISLPYYVFQVIPLQDSFGQARTPIMGNFLLDSKFISHSLEADDAVEAIRQHFENIDRSATATENVKISIRHEKYISYSTAGAKPDELLYHRGSQFRVWVVDI